MEGVIVSIFLWFVIFGVFLSDPVLVIIGIVFFVGYGINQYMEDQLK